MTAHAVSQVVDLEKVDRGGFHEQRFSLAEPILEDLDPRLGSGFADVGDALNLVGFAHRFEVREAAVARALADIEHHLIARVDVNVDVVLELFAGCLCKPQFRHRHAPVLWAYPVP